MNDTSMTIRTNKETKQQAQMIFSELGMDMSTAVNVFLRQAIIHRGFPFELTLESPNATTKKAMINAENGTDTYGPFDSVDALMEALNA
ncbi:MAG: type II toxin-antitoxin system RelB/DinJ family antitoxin [Oscillospiraceae bacterium]|nr:type II toxin-antitoxin system RelB/DinJ family antitoxin [Oscillospiraceae bacterium]MBQ7118975.1 type II toxin-antitoxin system RelB/DinJ family antitoxin [Oscillospiraceae bacterium]